MRIQSAQSQNFGAIEVKGFKPKSKNLHALEKFSQKNKVKLQDGLDFQHQSAWYISTKSNSKKENRLLKKLKQLLPQKKINACTETEMKETKQRLLNELK